MYDLNAPAPKTLEGTGSRRSDPLVGRTFNGRFRIEAQLAKGGMGKVYRAVQVPLGRAVALKVLNVAVAPEHMQAFHRRFFIEAATAARLNHPHTVTIFDYGRSDDGVYYIAMEYLDGQSLRQLLNEKAPLPPRRAVALAIQIARAVREAHGLGFMHRDLKPANVVLLEDDDGRDFAKVLDFGLAKSAHGAAELTRTGQFLGSPGYMAPEQIRGAPLDARCDIYALGAMLYEMLTGTQPFVRQGPMDTLMAHVHEEVPSFKEANAAAELPEALEAAVMMCLAKKPQNRPKDMTALMALLRQAVVSLPPLYPVREGGLDEYEQSGWAVVSPTGALRQVLGDSAPAAKLCARPEDDVLTQLSFDMLLDDENPKVEATAWDASHGHNAAANTWCGPVEAPAVTRIVSELPTLFLAPTQSPAPTQIGPPPAAPVASAAPAPVRRAPFGVRRLRGALLALVALLYAEPVIVRAIDWPEIVVLHLRTTPAGAKVWHDETLICEHTPCDIEWQPKRRWRRTALRFFVAGYDEYFTNCYGANQEQTLKVTLERSEPGLATP